MLLVPAGQRGLSRTLPGAEAALGLLQLFSPPLPKATLRDSDEGTGQPPALCPMAPGAAGFSLQEEKTPKKGAGARDLASPPLPCPRSARDAWTGTNVRLEVCGELSPGAVPSSPLEQISVPSALCWLRRSQPRAFVSSGKAVPRTSPAGLRVLRGSRQGCTPFAPLLGAPAAAARGVSVSPSPCPSL